MYVAFGLKLLDFFFTFQIFALLPIYLLQFCYGMNTGFPAILTPQLQEECSEFKITDGQVCLYIENYTAIENIPVSGRRTLALQTEISQQYKSTL